MGSKHTKSKPKAIQWTAADWAKVIGAFGAAMGGVAGFLAALTPLIKTLFGI
jgi:hypothetical protein